MSQHHIASMHVQRSSGISPPSPAISVRVPAFLVLVFRPAARQRCQFAGDCSMLQEPLSVSAELKVPSHSVTFKISLLDFDEIVEHIMLACDPYTAIAMTQTCRYMDKRFNNEIFWKAYSLPMRRRYLLPGQNIDSIKEDTYLEYIIARARPLS